MNEDSAGRDFSEQLSPSPLKFKKFFLKLSENMGI